MLERRVSALRAMRPDLWEALALQEQLIRTSLSSARAPRAEPFAMPREAVVARLRQGVPLLHDQPITLDVHYAADLFSRLINVLLDGTDPELTARLERLVNAATTGELDPERLFAEAFVQHMDHLAEMAAQATLDPDLLAMVAQRAVQPLLGAYAEHLLPLIERVDDASDRGAAWKYGYCPICGGWPLLGELRGLDLAQWLRCGGCGSGWRGQLLVCPYCANGDIRTLVIESEQRFRISVCDRCKGYLKVGKAFDAAPAELLSIDDLASRHLDLAAIQRGYDRPSGSGYRIELAVPDAEWLDELG